MIHSNHIGSLRSWRSSPLLFALLIYFISAPAHADMVWPAVYVFGSHLSFWYVSITGTIAEAFIFAVWLKTGLPKAFLISIVVNAFSATIGLAVLTFTMIGWHLGADTFAGGTFAPFNKVATIVLMLVGSIFLEALLCKLIWKYKLLKLLPIFALGNLASYAMVVVDLFFRGGWNQPM